MRYTGPNTELRTISRTLGQTDRLVKTASVSTSKVSGSLLGWLCLIPPPPLQQEKSYSKSSALVGRAKACLYGTVGPEIQACCVKIKDQMFGSAPSAKLGYIRCLKLTWRCERASHWTPSLPPSPSLTTCVYVPVSVCVHVCIS